MPAPMEPLRGEEVIRAEPARVFAMVTDLDALKEVIPDLVSSERVDERTMKCVVKPGFSFVRGTMNLTFAVESAVANETVAMRIVGQGIGMGMTVEAKLKLAPEDEGRATRLAWEAAITERKGLIAPVSPSLIHAAAEKVVRDGMAALRKRLEA